MKKALFWDFDGTLIHPNESFLDAMHTALSKHNFMVSPDEIRAFLRTACSWYTPEAAYTDKTGEQWWTALYDRFSLFYKKLGVPQAKEMIINNHFRQQILDSGNYTLYDDAVPVLKRCIDMGYKNFIFSVKISIPLENTGVSSVFAASVWPFSLIFSLARRNEGNFFQAVPTTLSRSLAEVRLASLVAWA